MGVSEILSPDRVLVSREVEGGVRDKAAALHRLAAMLAAGVPSSAGAAVTTPDEVERVLVEREALHSTGVGGGVAIPHGAIERLDRLVGAMLLCPDPIEFAAVDGAPVSILVSIIGPKRAAGEHLKMLARVSRLLRDESFRTRLLAAPDGRTAFSLITAEEGRAVSP